MGGIYIILLYFNLQIETVAMSLEMVANAGTQHWRTKKGSFCGGFCVNQWENRRKKVDISSTPHAFEPNLCPHVNEA